MVLEPAAVIETPAGRFPPPARVNERHEPVVIQSLVRGNRFPRGHALPKSKGLPLLCALHHRTSHRRLGCLGVGGQQPDAYSQGDLAVRSSGRVAVGQRGASPGLASGLLQRSSWH